MYIRTKPIPNTTRKSVQIVKSVRDGDKVKQKVVRYIGIAHNEDEVQRLLGLAEYIKAQLIHEHQPFIFNPEDAAQKAINHRRQKEDDREQLNVNLKQLREEQRTVVGIHEVYGKLFEELGFDKVIGNPKRNQAYINLLFHVAMARIAHPTSKRAAVAMLERDFGISLPLEKVYRMMDKLDAKAINRIQRIAFNKANSLLSGKIDVLLYDCTTLYFESFIEDELKQNGYSKDLKFNQSQVLLALLVTQEGLPIGYRVFPGATFEGKTLIPILKELREEYHLNQVIFVADSGMLSESNIQKLEEEGYHYIVGGRLRSLPQAMQTAVLDRNNYTECKEGEHEQRVGVFKQEGGRSLVVSYSIKRAEKDKHDREKAIEKLKKRISKSKNPKTLLSNYGYKKYLTITGETRVVINREKIEEESKWDGLHGVITNIADISTEPILSYYRGLWQIEECFRINKHDLKIRPIFHWTERRIEAHIAIAFISFVCVRHLEYRVAVRYRKLSPEVIRKELVHVQVSFLKHKETGERYCVPSNVSPEAKKIYQIMGIKLSCTPFKLD